MKFIIDKPILLTKETDFLKTKQYAHTLKNVIDNAPQGKVLPLGFLGNLSCGEES